MDIESAMPRAVRAHTVDWLRPGTPPWAWTIAGDPPGRSPRSQVVTCFTYENIANVGGMTYDVAAVRAHFPALKAGTAHFDGPGGSQAPDVVAEAVAGTLTSPIANRGRVTAAERAGRRHRRSAPGRAMADLLGATRAASSSGAA